MLTSAGGRHAPRSDVHAYHVAFLVAAGLALAAAVIALTVHDSGAAATIRRSRRERVPVAEPSTA
ncbi:MULTISPECIES: hypothetical protein [unclassified Pseudofrankia]|uniref:hypothetical protein n=1 Tax=unclassified Pseudofrankia TaxID=2994372 RepID=UPI0008D92530|nr:MULTISPECIES: hypothetical protein [unclassified Pseudofrankia]MDT3446331.1 hypothetical protein [Pseudofrankia sp. BMG5.37]OHV56738.1 hypothetical protein BCD48_43595 [Pseudofrankia sp. BMG5.36]